MDMLYKRVRQAVGRVSKRVKAYFTGNTELGTHFLRAFRTATNQYYLNNRNQDVENHTTSKQQLATAPTTQLQRTNTSGSKKNRSIENSATEGCMQIESLLKNPSDHPLNTTHNRHQTIYLIADTSWRTECKRWL